MSCQNMIRRPKNKVARVFVGSLDKCEYLKQMKGVNFHVSKDSCPIEKICKHYKEVEGVMKNE